MAIKFPRLTGSGLIHLSVCARLGKSKELSKLKQRADDSRDIGFIRLPSGEYLFCTFHGDKNVFFHVEIATREYIGKGKPKIVGGIRIVEKMFDAALDAAGDQPVKVASIGTFVEKIESLPKQGIIRATLQTDQVPGMTVSMRLIGGKVALKGTPFEKLEWSLQEDESVVEARLFTKREVVKIDDGYLAAHLNLMKSGFRVLVLDREAGRVRKK